MHHLRRFSSVLTLFCTLLWASLAQAGAMPNPLASSLQDRIDNAQPGDTIAIPAGSYSERLTINVSGTAQAPITLRGAGAGATTIVGTLRISGAHITIADLTVDANGDSRDAIRIEAPANSIAIRGVHLHNGSGYGVRVGNDVSQVLIEQCRINNFDAGSADAHGVGIMTAQRVTVRDCDIYDNSGDAIQVNTPDEPGYGRQARHIRIERNRLHDCRENAIDLKSSFDVVVAANQIWGFRAVESSDGMAVQVQYNAQNIALVGNRIWSAVEGIEVSRGSKNGTAYPQAPQHVLIAGNLIANTVADAAGDSANGSGIVIRTSSDVRVYNNTVLTAASAGLYVGSSAGDDYPQRLDIRNNVFDGKANDLQISVDAARIPGLLVDYNHYVGGRVNSATLEAWTARGYERHASSGAPQLDAAGLPAAGSPLIDSGVAVGQPFTGSAPDRGWGEIDGAAGLPAAPYQVFMPVAIR